MWCIFSGFGVKYQEKSGNPVANFAAPLFSTLSWINNLASDCFKNAARGGRGRQGCQICHTKTGKNTPNCRKIDQIAVK
jgi:hypothetical protein